MWWSASREENLARTEGVGWGERLRACLALVSIVEALRLACTDPHTHFLNARLTLDRRGTAMMDWMSGPMWRRGMRLVDCSHWDLRVTARTFESSSPASDPVVLLTPTWWPSSTPAAHVCVHWGIMHVCTTHVWGRMRASHKARWHANTYRPTASGWGPRTTPVV